MRVQQISSFEDGEIALNSPTAAEALKHEPFYTALHWHMTLTRLALWPAGCAYVIARWMSPGYCNTATATTTLCLLCLSP
jgi:hypothetical protein